MGKCKFYYIIYLRELIIIIIYIFFIRDTWRTHSDFSLLKTLLSKIKETFVHSPARKGRYLAHLKMHGIENPCKILLLNALH